MHEYRVEIVKVVDGDTVDVDIDLGFGIWMKNERVRLFGIDTPESRTRDLEEKKYGLAAKQYLIDKLNAGTPILKTFKDGVGKYGRILGEFFVTEPDVHPVEFNLNQEMIKDGYGVAYYGQSKQEIEASHLENRKILLERGDYIPVLDKRGKEIKQM